MRATRLTCLLFLGFQVFLEDTHKTNTNEEAVGKKEKKKAREKQKS